MHSPLFIRELTSTEQQSLEAGLRSRSAFTLRRCQILLASAAGQVPAEISRHLGCSKQTVRNVIRAFAQEGLDCLVQKSSRPKSVQPVLDEQQTQSLQALLHESPRNFGQPRSTWTLEAAAQAAFQQGITPREVSHETIRRSIRRLKVGWKRAKHWITSPDPAYARKKILAIA